MKTMGLAGLALAACPGYDDAAVRTMAVHAADVYESAVRYSDLASSLSECTLSAGFTRRRGARRKSFSLSVADFAARIRDRSGRIALVFGNERSGLSGPELSLCSFAVHIPASEAFPSLNLAQAVQIACYELRRNALGSKDGSASPVSREQAIDTIARIGAVLGGRGFFRISDGRPLLEFLRDIVERSGMTVSELAYFEALFRKTAALSGRDAGSESIDDSL